MQQARQVRLQYGIDDSNIVGIEVTLSKTVLVEVNGVARSVYGALQSQRHSMQITRIPISTTAESKMPVFPCSVRFLPQKQLASCKSAKRVI
jgi:hypothetical protein